MSGTTNRSLNPHSSELDQIIQSLKEIIATQGRHTVMLKQMLEAATRPIEGTSPVAVALEALVTSTNNQTSALQTLTKTMQDLPDQISAGMKAEIDRAMNES